MRRFFPSPRAGPDEKSRQEIRPPRQTGFTEVSAMRLPNSGLVFVSALLLSLLSPAPIYPQTQDPVAQEGESVQNPPPPSFPGQDANPATSTCNQKAQNTSLGSRYQAQQERHLGAQPGYVDFHRKVCRYVDQARVDYRSQCRQPKSRIVGLDGENPKIGRSLSRRYGRGRRYATAD